MHYIRLTDGEVALLKEAREKRDWSILPTFKLKYLYQRLVAFPRSDLSAVKSIAELARKGVVEREQSFVDEVKEAFGGK